MLGDRGRDVTGIAAHRVAPGDQHDAAPVLCDHAGQEGLAEMDGALEVRSHHPPPVVGGGLEERFVRADRRVGDENINRAEFLQRERRGALRLGGDTDVGYHH